MEPDGLLPRRWRSFFGAVGALAVHGAAAFALSLAPLSAAAPHAAPALVWLDHASIALHGAELGSSGASDLAQRASSLPMPSVDHAALGAFRRTRAARARPSAAAESEPSVQLSRSAPAEVPAKLAPAVPDARAEPGTPAPEPTPLAGKDAQVASATHGTASATGGGSSALETGTGAASGPGSSRAPAGPARHGPGLHAFGNPCLDYFPAAARADHGEVQLEVEVDREGHARASRVMIEWPRGQGFGSAASACARRLRFSPAVDALGKTVAGHAKLKLAFDRG